MGRRERQEFPTKIKREVKADQQDRCGYCGEFCRGHGFSEPPLEIHHIIPASREGPCTRENAVGLCGCGGNNCHQHFDTLYFKEGKTYFDVLMEEGRLYDLRQHPGNPYPRRELKAQRKALSGD